MRYFYEQAQQDILDFNTVQKLNHLGPRSAQSGMELQCALLYVLYELKEMVENEKEKDDILKCFDEYEEMLKWQIRENGQWLNAIFRVLKEHFPDLEGVDLQKIVTTKALRYNNGQAGAK